MPTTVSHGRFGRSRPNLRGLGPGSEFAGLLDRVTDDLRHVFRTQGDVLTFPASGTGVMEAAIVNCFSPGDAVLAIVNGAYSERSAAAAEAFGLDVDRLPVPLGKAPEPAEVAQALRRLPAPAGVLLTHDETSTGAICDLEGIALAVRAHAPDALIVVDATSSLGAVEVRADAWDLDVVVSASEHGLMAPPGLGLAAVGPRAWSANRRARLPRFYWDFADVRDRAALGQARFSPPLPVYEALETSLRHIRQEGLEAIFARQVALGESVRSGVRALGLEPFADPRYASPTVTAVHAPAGVTADALIDRMARLEHVELAGGLGTLAGELLRIGHVGAVQPRDIRHCLAALKRQLAGSGLRERLEAQGAPAFATP